MIDIISIIFIILAVFIVLGTPKGCNRTINTILACMLIFIFGLEEATKDMLDGAWYDVSLSVIYATMAFLFYRVGGYVQSALTSVGLVLHIGYLCIWSFNELPMNLFYSEVFITLTAVQLLAASNGVLRPLLYRMLNGGDNGRSNRSCPDVSGRSIANRNNH